MTAKSDLQKNVAKPQRSTSRRAFLQTTSLAAGGVGLSSVSLFAQNTSTRKPLNRFPRMVQEYFVDRLRDFDQERSDHIYRLATAQDAQQYVQSVRHKIRQSCHEVLPFSCHSNRLLWRTRTEWLQNSEVFKKNPN